MGLDVPGRGHSRQVKDCEKCIGDEVSIPSGSSRRAYPSMQWEDRAPKTFTPCKILPVAFANIAV
ncbi:hypothetical protein GCM10009085_19690 [Pseudomonas avellanae]|nr:hypothetical protein GCM10009085_19690 [Pseudomonas avellanae]